MIVASIYSTHCYAIDIQREILLASKAAPTYITNSASYMIFQNGKFELIKQGENNFTCLVVRNPEGRFEPACFNEQAMRGSSPIQVGAFPG